MQCEAAHQADYGSEPPLENEEDTEKAERGIEPYVSYLKSRGGWDLYCGELDLVRDAKLIANKDWEKIKYNFFFNSPQQEFSP